MNITLNITENDFRRLRESCMSAALFSGPDQRPRFEIVDEENFLEPDFANTTILWFGDNFASALIGREYLLANDHSATIMWDMAQHPNGEFFGYAIFTSYRYESATH